MKTLTRDDTEHGAEYVLREEAEAAIQTAIDQANARQNASWRLMCEKVVAAERERLLSLAKKRADYEANAAAHHSGKWHEAYQFHLTRHSAMRDLIAVLEGSTAPAQAAGCAPGEG